MGLEDSWLVSPEDDSPVDGDWLAGRENGVARRTPTLPRRWCHPGRIKEEAVVQRLLNID